MEKNAITVAQGKYKIVSLLGKGSFGVLYAGVDLKKSDITVAVKLE